MQKATAGFTVGNQTRFWESYRYFTYEACEIAEFAII